ncbi:hypothetical protein DNTS_009553 [Danionella cerebrum]|uniref:RING-type domain-containing protein n=1 Tax=Danionella cerebrum TaxID=2873325 RepID=A0A553RPR5_9TELE|nr:hypothetical protein DNTS_009553 [Danionella translucida]
MTEQLEEKRYDPKDTSLKFVARKDEITLDDDPSVLRAEMSCGHAVTPESLTGWCRSLLDQGQYKFPCPALTGDDARQKCNKEWPYVECPGCQSFVERANLTNLCVLCTVCKAEKGRSFQFCWQCMRPWKGEAPRSDRCDNPGCTNPDIEKLAKCRDITLPSVANVKCPSMRACPTCGNLVEHNTTGCKNIICNRCRVEFCFICLKVTKECLKSARHFTICPGGVAPRQTSIPKWQRN